MKKLLLFDIDGTLIDSGGAGLRALTLSFKEVLDSRNDLGGVAMAGRTDLAIIKDMLGRNNMPADDGVLPLIIDAYLKHLEKEILNSSYMIQPGVITLLEKLQNQDGISLGLLTGNIMEGARIKLQRGGINRYFSFGAFGSDHEDRNRLLPVAIKRYQEVIGGDIDASDCIIIGDTPRDVECAVPYGAQCIAVATGPYSMDDLRKTEAHLVLADLSAHDTVMDFVLQR